MLLLIEALQQLRRPLARGAVHHRVDQVVDRVDDERDDAEADGRGRPPPEHGRVGDHALRSKRTGCHLFMP